MDEPSKAKYSPEARRALLFFALGSVFFSFIVFQCGGFLLTGFGQWLQLPDGEAWAQGLAQILFLFIPACLLAWNSPQGWRESLRLDGDVRAMQWLIGMLGILAINVFTAGWLPVQESLLPDSVLPVVRKMQELMEESYRIILGGNGAGDVLRALIVGAVIPAFAEEFLFRGYLQRSLEEISRPRNAITLTAVIFAFIHLNPIVLVPLALIGAYLGFLAWYTRSLGLPVFLHFFNNALSIVAMYYTGGKEESPRVESGLGEAAFIAFGGLCLLVLCLYLVMRFAPRKIEASIEY